MKRSMRSTIHFIQSSRFDVFFRKHISVDVLQINEIIENVFEDVHSFMSSGEIVMIVDS